MQGEADLIWVILRIAPIVISLATLAYVIWSGEKQTNQLSKQTDYLRRQIFGEIYDKAQIRDLQFYLPAKEKHSVEGFEDGQEEKEELSIGKEISITKEEEVEAHVRCWLDAPQRIRMLIWGFEGGPNPPSISYEEASFKAVEKSAGKSNVQVYQDWHGHWHMEFPFPKFVPKNACMVLSFTIEGSNEGQFPLAFEIVTEEAKEPYKENLWVRVGG